LYAQAAAGRSGGDDLRKRAGRGKTPPPPADAARSREENPAVGGPWRGFLRRNLRGKEELAEKTCNRDHDACDPRGQASKQQKVAQEKRHASYLPDTSPVLRDIDIP